MADVPLFEVEDLCVSTSAAVPAPGAEILSGVSLTVNAGEIHVLVGPQGCGMSTLATALLGSPKYHVTSGSIRLHGDDVTTWDTDVRAKAGMFLAFQDPQEIAGVSILNLLRQALSARKGIEMSARELRLSVMDWMEKLSIDPSLVDRDMNDGFSMVEKKQNEVLQMAVLEPELAILDETYADLNTNALQAVAFGVQARGIERPLLGTLVITHHNRLLQHLEPDYVHVLVNGHIVASGGPELANKLETDGYEALA